MSPRQSAENSNVDPLEKAIGHQTAINLALNIPEWDKETMKEVRRHRNALQTMIEGRVLPRNQAPDVVDSLENIVVLADQKLKGQPLTIEEYLEPEKKAA